MAAHHGENYLPWSTTGVRPNIKTPEQMKKAILSAHEVKEAMAQLVRERTK